MDSLGTLGESVATIGNTKKQALDGQEGDPPDSSQAAAQFALGMAPAWEALAAAHPATAPLLNHLADRAQATSGLARNSSAASYMAALQFLSSLEVSASPEAACWAAQALSVMLSPHLQISAGMVSRTAVRVLAALGETAPQVHGARRTILLDGYAAVFAHLPPDVHTWQQPALRREVQRWLLEARRPDVHLIPERLRSRLDALFPVAHPADGAPAGGASVDAAAADSGVSAVAGTATRSRRRGRRCSGGVAGGLGGDCHRIRRADSPTRRGAGRTALAPHTAAGAMEQHLHGCVSGCSERHHPDRGRRPPLIGGSALRSLTHGARRLPTVAPVRRCLVRAGAAGGGVCAPHPRGGVFAALRGGALSAAAVHAAVSPQLARVAHSAGGIFPVVGGCRGGNAPSAEGDANRPTTRLSVAHALLQEVLLPLLERASPDTATTDMPAALQPLQAAVAAAARGLGTDRFLRMYAHGEARLCWLLPVLRHAFERTRLKPYLEWAHALDTAVCDEQEHRATSAMRRKRLATWRYQLWALFPAVATDALEGAWGGCGGYGGHVRYRGGVVHRGVSCIGGAGRQRARRRPIAEGGCGVANRRASSAVYRVRRVGGVVDAITPGVAAGIASSVGSSGRCSHPTDVVHQSRRSFSPPAAAAAVADRSEYRIVPGAGHGGGAGRRYHRVAVAAADDRGVRASARRLSSQRRVGEAGVSSVDAGVGRRHRGARSDDVVGVHCIQLLGGSPGVSSALHRSRVATGPIESDAARVAAAASGVAAAGQRQQGAASCLAHSGARAAAVLAGWRRGRGDTITAGVAAGCRAGRQRFGGGGVCGG
eukprot:ctg_1351.g451